MEFDWFWFTVIVLVICVTIYSCLDSYWKYKSGDREDENK